jgi:two-component system, NarL family, invasion response regulator UvrY
MYKLLIVDDHPVVRRGVREILEDEADMESFETSDAAEAKRLLARQDFDLVLLDLDLPGKNGLDLLKELKREKPKLPILILSIHPEEQFAVRVLKAGASGFISKDSAPLELIKAARRILSGGKYINEKIAEILLMEATAEITSNPHERLSDREFQILCLLGAGKNIKTIASDLCLSVPTISTYRARILEKLNLRTTAELIRYAVENQLTTSK